MKSKRSTLTPLLLTLTLLSTVIPSTSQQRGPKEQLPDISSHNIQDILPPYQKVVSLQQDQLIYYKIDLSNSKQDRDLSVSVISLDETAPQAFLSKSNQFPSSPQDADYTAAVTPTGGVIFVPHTQLKGVKTMYLGIQCILETCKADLAVEYSIEFDMIANGRFYDQWPDSLGDVSSVVIRLSVPQDESAQRLVINAEAILTQVGHEPYVQLYVNQGDEIPYSEKAQKVPGSTWFEGKTLPIHRTSDLFCTGCNYTLSIKFSPHSALRVQATLFDETTEVWRHRFTDAVDEGHQNRYSMNIEKKLENEDLLIFVNPQNGAPTVYINCDFQPGDVSDYKWSYNIHKPEDIIIGSKEIQSCSSQVYYIAVYGNVPSVYTIAAHTKSTGHLRLGTDVPLTGDLLPGEEIREEFVVPLDVLEKLEIELETTSDINITVINCRFTSDCPGLVVAKSGSSFTFQHPSIQPEAFQYDIVDTGRGKKITIDPHTNGCYPLLLLENIGFLHPVCAYMVILRSEQRDPAEYTLTIDLEGHQVLLPATPRLGTIYEDENRYYMLNVPNQNVTEVSFQLTMISGDAVLSVSRTEEYPAQGISDAQLAFEGRVVFKNETKLNGTYYVAVHGYQPGSYILTATVLDAFGNPEDYALQLQEGVPQKGVLFPKHENPVLFYRILVDVEDDWEGTLKILIVPLRGKLLLVANNRVGEMPSTDQEKWNNAFNYLKIKSTDEDFVRKGVYHVGVFIDWSDPNSFLLEDITFTITYQLVGERTGIVHEKDEEQKEMPETKKSHMVLTGQFPFHGEIKDKEIQYFKVLVTPDDESITIYKEADYGNVEVYASVSPKNKYPDQKEYDVTTKNTDEDFLIVTKKDLEKACMNGKGKKKKARPDCEIYFSIVKDLDGREDPPELGDEKERKDGEIGYTVRIKEEVQTTDIFKRPLISLENGLDYGFELPRENEPSSFYFYPIPGKDVHIVVSSHFRSPVIYVNTQEYHIEAGKKQKEQSQWPIPTDEKHDFSSISNGNSEGGIGYVMLPGTAEDNPTPTVVVVSVYFKPLSSRPQVSESNPSGTQTFSIVVSSEKKKIVSGRTYPGTVQEKMYTYYEINVKRKDCTLLIVLTSMDSGDADLVISYDSRIVPTLKTNKLAATSRQRTEMMEVSLADIYPKESMQGTWIIGVYGRTKTSYTLTVAYEDQKMLEVRAGFPLELYLKPNANIYLKYIHDVGGDFFMRIDKQSGDLRGYINTVKQNSDIASSLPNSTNHIWAIKSEQHSKLLIPHDDENFCSGCIYLILLQPEQASKIVFSVFEEGSMYRIQRSLSYSETLDAGKTEWYFFTANYVEEVLLNVNVMSGEISVFASHNPTVNATNHIWYKTLSSEHPPATIKMLNSEFTSQSDQKAIWDGNSTVTSLDNVFYLYFVNEGKDKAKFTFYIEDQNSSTVLVLDKYYHSVLDAYKSKSFLYYSPYTKEILVLTTTFCFEAIVDKSAPSSLNNGPLGSIKPKGLKTSVKFWEHSLTAGVGAPIRVYSDFIVDHFESVPDSDLQQVCIMQTDRFEGAKKEGRYEILLENTYQYELDISMYIHTTKTEVRTFDKNEAYFGIMESGQKSIYDIYSARNQAWYFDIVVCRGSLQLKFANSSQELETDPTTIKTLGQGEDFVFTAHNKNKKTTYVSLESLESNGTEVHYLVRSNHFDEDAAMPFEQLEKGPQLTHKHIYSEDASSLEVYYEPVVWKVASESEPVFYSVKVCPKKNNETVLDQCAREMKETAKCYTQALNTVTTSQDKGTVRFDNVPLGDFSVVVLGSVSHKGKNVYYQLYPAKDITLTAPTQTIDWDLVLYGGIGLAVLFVSFLIYRAVRRHGKSKRMIAGPMSEGYGFLGEDGR